MNSILLATDFGARSLRAEEQARAIAAAFGARTVILHVIESIEDDGKSEEVRNFYADLEKRAETELETVRERYAAAGLDCETRVAVGSRWHIIVDTAHDEEFNLVVIGTHDVVQGDRAYIGTVSHKVFFACKRPLLVVPS